MARLLLHICCGPCATYPVPVLREQNHDITGYFYNPNIHPYSEYLKRQEALQQYAGQVDLPIIYDKAHDPNSYLRETCFRESQRCRICYTLRLEQTARVARRGGYDYFTTTLLVSRMQKHDMIKEVGNTAASKYGVPFLYQDFREGFAQSGVLSRAMGLYRQQYCGCIYSEFERYGGAKRLKEAGNE